MTDSSKLKFMKGLHRQFSVQGLKPNSGLKHGKLDLYTPDSTATS